MNVEYDGKTYTLDIEDIDVLQATLIKVKTGCNLKQWEAQLDALDVDAMRALYWIMLDQNGVRENYDNVNFKIVRFAKAVQAAQAAEEDKDAEENPTGAKPTGEQPKNG